MGFNMFKKIRFDFGFATIALLGIIFWVFFAGVAEAARIKDLATIKGVQSKHLVGYGLVVGLNGTGDKSGADFTMQSITNMMKRMGIEVNKEDIKVKNVAAVMISANMPPFARSGSKLDINISSIGDAKSLQGGTLLLTPLKDVEGNVFALAQGSVALGGYGAQGAGASNITNHLLVSRISNGATVQRSNNLRLNKHRRLTMSLNNPDFTTVLRVTDKINRVMGQGVARALDSSAIQLFIPDEMAGQVAKFIADIEVLDVTPDTIAKIVVNEKTGTVVIGENVSISTVAVAHGNLTISVKEKREVSQPEALSEGITVTTTQPEIQVVEEKSNVMLMPASSTIGELVKALNAIGVSPRDMISIFQSIKAAGALQAELEII